MNCWLPIKTEDKKVMLVFNDFVVKYDVCNFKCDYCLNQMKPDQTDIWKSTEKVLFLDEKQVEELIYSDNSSLGVRMNKIVSSFQQNIDSAILRISGGEILGIKNIEKFIEKFSSEFEVIQIVTNGYFLTKDMVNKLGALGNVQLHYSLDGHNLKLNGYRVKSLEIQNRLMNNLEHAVAAGIAIEIGSVLTTANTKNFVEFLEYLLIYEYKLRVHPSPVRGEQLKHFYPDKESIKSFSQILNNYDRFTNILPPIAYMQQLIKFMADNERVLQCHLPKAAIQTVDKGSLTPCPNGWTLQMGNLLYEDSTDISMRIGREKIYNLLLQERPRLKYCKGCYTAYDIVNLYISGMISDEELKMLPLYSGPKVSLWMKLLREQYKSTSGEINSEIKVV